MSSRLHLPTSALLVTSLVAQGPTPGFRQQLEPLPSSASCVFHTHAGTVYFDGADLRLASRPAGSPPLLHLPTPAFGSFTVAVDASTLLFGESSTHAVWLVPLAGPAPNTPLATVPFNYDAVRLDARHMLVSARTGGFASAFNDVVSLDLTTGAIQPVLHLPGASGPVTVGPGGDLFYATAALSYPPPLGAATVLRFARGAVDQVVAGGPTLGINDGQVTASGLDSVGDLAFDDDGDLYFVDWWNYRVGELGDAESTSQPLPTWPLDYAGTWVGPATLQFEPHGGQGVFEPYQPANGSLIVFETDYFSSSQVRTLTTRQPDLRAAPTSSLPTGAFVLALDQGPANGLAILAFELTPPGPITGLQIPGFAQPLWWDAALSSPALVVAPLSAIGRTTFQLTNPGFAVPQPGLAQVVVLSTGGAIGASRDVSMTLGQ